MLIFFTAFFGYLLTWGPLFMGYEKETAQSALALWHGSLQIFRAGIGAALLYQPFIVLSAIFPVHQIALLTMVPLFYSAAAVSIIFLILRKITGRISVSIAVSLMIAFGSLLWPYSRIGMAYPLTFFITLLLLSLLYWKENRGSILFAGAGLALAVLSVSYGILLCLPAFIFIFLELKQQNRLRLLFSPLFLTKLFGLAALGIISVMVINQHLYGHFGGVYFLKQEFQIWSWWEGFFGTFFSFGKSIFVYNPLLILAVFFWPAFWQKYRSIAGFILSAFFVLLIITAPFSFWSDETLSVRKLVPIIPLLHLPLFLVWDNFHKIKKICFTILLGLAVYAQLITSLYPYWRQLEFLRPYNLDNLTTIRYSPRLSQLALSSAFFGSFVKSRTMGQESTFFFLEKSWMRCCTYPREADVTEARINISLNNFERPDTYLFGAAPLSQRKIFLLLDISAIVLLGGFLAINYINHKEENINHK